MALYWPEQKVALDIVDDPHRNPFEGDESYTVLRVTCAELSNYESFDRIQKKLCKLLGASYPQGKEWKRKNRRLFEMLRACGMGDDGSGEADSEPTEESDEFGERDMFDGDLLDDLMENMSSLCEEVEILAPSREAADYMAAAAEQEGHSVRGISIWEGPIPEGSFRQLSPHMRMSTPEFFFMRKANELWTWETSFAAVTARRSLLRISTKATSTSLIHAPPRPAYASTCAVPMEHVSASVPSEFCATCRTSAAPP